MDFVEGSDEEDPWFRRRFAPPPPPPPPREQKLLTRHQPRHPHQSTAKMIEKDFTCLRRTGFFSDAVIRVGNVRFPVHRNIISCCSPYFRALFEDTTRSKTTDAHLETAFDSDQRQNVQEDGHTTLTGASDDSDSVTGSRLSLNWDKKSKDKWKTSSPPDETGSNWVYPASSVEVNIVGVTPDVMNDIIEHAYGGDVTITDQNLESLLIGADRFQVNSLLCKCCQYLESQMTLENCISIVRFVSQFFQCETTRLRGTQFFLDNFVDVSQTSQEYYHLSSEELKAVLRADRLNVRQEEQVLDAIIRWVMTEPGRRQQHISQLVLCCRVGLMLPENMNSFIDSWLVPGRNQSQHSSVTFKVMESVLCLQKQQMAHLDPAMFAHRLPRDVLLVVGGSNHGFPLNHVEAFDCRTWVWATVASADFAPRSYHGLVTLDNEIYVLGGFSGHVYLNSCCRFKPETFAWEDVTPMNTKRCYVGCAVLNGHIYAVGGYDGVHRLRSAERLDTDSNQWSFISPMHQQRSDAGVAVLGDKLYVCGGFNGEECIRAVESYSPETDCWSVVTSMLCGRSGLGLVGYGSCLYAVGGFDGTDGTVRLPNLESFNPTTSQWTTLQQMPHPRSNLAVEILEDMLYAMGGYNGERTTCVVEAYDFRVNMWYPCTGLSHNRSALGACVISGLSNTPELLGRVVSLLNVDDFSRD